MKHISNMIEDIEEEISDAKKYAERFAECKAMGDMGKAEKYKEMANDELKHASFLHAFVTEEFKKLLST